MPAGLLEPRAALFASNTVRQSARQVGEAPQDGEKLLLRPKLVRDGALPSGNSVALVAPVRLARLTGNKALQARAASLARWRYGSASQAPL